MHIQSQHHTNISKIFTTLTKIKTAVVCGSHQLYISTKIIEQITLENQNFRTCSGQRMTYYSHLKVNIAKYIRQNVKKNGKKIAVN